MVILRPLPLQRNQLSVQLARRRTSTLALETRHSLTTFRFADWCETHLETQTFEERLLIA